MTQARTAAQAAQDKNKDKSGKFQHGKTQENVGVQLGAVSQSDEMKKSMVGVEALGRLANDVKRQAADTYVRQLSRVVRDNYPAATAINFNIESEHEAGLVARFESITDARGRELEVDQELFGGYGHEAFAYQVDAAALQDQLERTEGGDGNAHHVYELDSSESKDEPFARQIRAENYGHELLLMSEILEEQRANAAVSVAMHNVIDSFPGLEEVTLGRTFEAGRSAQVDSFVQSGKRFERPSNTGRYSSPDGIEWFRLDGSLDHKVDYSSVIAKPVDVQEALHWSPGQKLA